MIPRFDESGRLSAGVHPATLDEIDARFGHESELRRVQMESVRWMIDLARRAAVQRIILNGSFVTDIMEPNDVDCVLLLMPGHRRDRGAVKQLRSGLPFLDLKLVGQVDFDEYVNVTFGTDRDGLPKGVIEVIL
ncbi:MAG TPA: hypothetical protein VHD56_05685 [Tepidisphaeraceae bacterium]|nr:hypothetical protein [Tepidisphaeraceae bacterium]